jgi:glycosyltransferase involved in cell wall biosynthesis
MGKNKIFVQIASYRDPQLIPTIKDMLENAKKPKNLVLSIARQYNETDGFDDLNEYKNDPRFKILDIPYQESRGVCWARNLTQQLYDGEEYTMQIDSHMRFEKNWDETLIKMIKGLQKDGYKKPLLTGYVPSFDPENDPQGRATDAWRMVFDRFIPEGAVFFLPETIPGWREMKKPVTARFYSAHFCFTLGQFSVEVQHNPDYYFHGEEISIAARSYTWGYDLFHPHIPVVYHEYTRKGRTKQWDDDKEWGNRNKSSHLANRKLFGMDGEIQEGHDGPFGFGKVRTLRDYEKYSGLLFEKRAVQRYTLDKNYPPNPYNYSSEEEWKKDFASVYKHCIDISYSSVPEKDYNFWAVAFHGPNDETLFRKDADKFEIERMMKDPDGYCKVWREFQTDILPTYWVVWPYSESKGWCDRITGQLNHNHVS